MCACVCESINHAKGGTGYFTDMEMKERIWLNPKYTLCISQKKDKMYFPLILSVIKNFVWKFK